MKFTIDMPKVATCAATDCAYNTERSCHARAITVGDVRGRATCGTYLPSKEHTRGDGEAGIGACKATTCVHNRDFECHAEQIQVGPGNGSARCLTYEPRA